MALDFGYVLNDPTINPCTFVNVCLTNPQCIRPAITANQFSGYGMVGNVEYKDGCEITHCCYGLSCGSPVGSWEHSLFSTYDDIEICDNVSLLPPIITPFIPQDPKKPWVFDEGGCRKIKTQYLRTFGNNIATFIAKYGQKKVDAFIRDFVLRYGPIDSKNLEQNCALVTYCNDDFKFLGSNFKEVLCGLPIGQNLIVPECETFIPSTHLSCEIYKCNNKEYSVCEKCESDTKKCFELVNVSDVINPLKNPNDISLNRSDSDINFKLPPIYHNKEFDKLTYFYTNDSFLLVNGIIKKDEYKYIMDFHPISNMISGVQDTNNEINNVYVDVPNHLFSYSVLLKDNNALKFISKNNDNLSKYLFTNNSNASYGDIINIKDGFILPINYNGNLLLNDSVIGISNKGGVVFAKYNINQDLFSTINVENATSMKNKGKSMTWQLIMPIDLDKKIVVNNTEISHSNNLILLNSETLESKNTNLNLGQFKLIDYSICSNTAYIGIYGSGSFSIRNISFQSHFDSSFIIIKIKDNSVIILKELNAKNIVLNSINLESNCSNNFVIGYSKLIGNSNLNIIVENYKPDGTLINDYNLGSDNNEILKEMMIANNDFLYLGGNIVGKSSISKIGSYSFSSSSDNFNDPFISVVNLNSIVDTNSTIRSDNSSSLGINKYILFPQPSGEYIMISSNYKSESEVKIKLYDSIGSLIYQEKTSCSDLVSKKLDMQEYSNGFYFITFEQDNRIIQSNKIIKISK
jgi:hypothetical protein